MANTNNANNVTAGKPKIGGAVYRAKRVLHCLQMLQRLLQRRISVLATAQRTDCQTAMTVQAIR